ncbi:MAG: YfhO family protein [Eubacteriales bacterium]|nr:YfhO family protein [Eubacteriales bacterium]
MKKRKRDLGLVLLYTLLFVVISTLIFGSFRRNGLSMIENNDSWNQHIRALQYYSDWLQKIAKNLIQNHQLIVPHWDLSIGYGSDILTTLNYYAIGDPLTLLAVFVPDHQMVHFYSLMIILRIYLAGLSYICLVRYFENRRLGIFWEETSGEERTKRICAILAGAFIYSFCAFTLVMGVRHPFFLNALIGLPLMVVGAEKILQGESPAMFMLVVCISLMTNFYMFYMQGINIVMYVFVRVVKKYGIRERKQIFCWIWKFAGYTAVGMGMGCIVFLPVLLRLKNGARNSVVEGIRYLYSAEFYQKLPLTFFMPSANAGHHTVGGYAFVAVICLLLLFLERKKLTEMKALFLVMLAAACSPIAGRIFNGFAYASNRWLFGFSLLIACIVTWKWEAMFRMKKSIRWIVFAVLTVIGLYFLLMKKADRWNVVGMYLLIAAVLLAVVSCLEKPKLKTAASLVMLALTFWSVAGNGSDYLQHRIDKGNYKTISSVRKNFIPAVEKAVLSLEETPDEFFRYSAPYGLIQRNSTLKTGLSSLHYYWSMGDRVLKEYFDETEVNEMMAYKFRTLDGRTGLTTLASVRYFVTEDGTKQVPPYGYEKVGEYTQGNQKYVIFENQNALPFGYTYDSCLSKEAWEGMNAQEKEAAMLEGVYLEEIPEGYPTVIPEKTDREIDWEWGSADEVEREEWTFDAEEGGCISLDLKEKVKDCEVSVTVRKIEYLSKSGEENESVKLQIYGKDGSITAKTLRFLVSSHVRFGGLQDYVVNLGYIGEEADRIELIFPSAGKYRMEGLQVIAQPMDSYKENIRARKAEVLEHTEFTADRIRGTISLKQAKILCLSMLYSDGWTAYVDGEKTELLTANLMYTALPLSAGEHTIELRYRTPGQTAGDLISLAGIVIFAVILGLKRKNRGLFQKKKL